VQILGIHVVLTGKLLKSLALGFWDEEGSENTTEHEEGEDLHDVIEPWRAGGFVWTRGDEATGTERSDSSLSNDGADLSRGSGDTVGAGTVTSWEAFTRNDEGGSVGSKVEEELDDNVKTELTVGRDLVEGETPDDEKNGQDDESYELNWFASDGVNSGDGEPVTRNGTSTDDNAVTGSDLEELVVDVSGAGKSDSLKDSRLVKTETIESNIKEEP